MVNKNTGVATLRKHGIRLSKATCKLEACNLFCVSGNRVKFHKMLGE